MNLVRGYWVLHHRVTGVRNVGNCFIAHVVMVHPQVLLELFHVALVNLLSLDHIVINRLSSLSIKGQKVKVVVRTMANCEV